MFPFTVLLHVVPSFEHPVQVRSLSDFEVFGSELLLSAGRVCILEWNANERHRQNALACVWELVIYCAINSKLGVSTWSCGNDSFFLYFFFSMMAKQCALRMFDGHVQWVK